MTIECNLYKDYKLITYASQKANIFAKYHKFQELLNQENIIRHH